VLGVRVHVIFNIIWIKGYMGYRVREFRYHGLRVRC
jgi:hypothetical protein